MAAMTRRLLGLWTIAVLSAPGLTAAEKPEGDAGRPALEDLLKYNSAAIFGGQVAILGEDRFEVTFDKAGQMIKGFEGQAIMDETSPGAQGANKRFYTKQEKGQKEAKPIEKLAAVAIAPPGSQWTIWTSRFPVGGDVKVTFDFRIPNLLTIESGFFVRIHSTKSQFIQNTFFNTLEMGATKATTTVKQFFGPASKWFPRKEGKEVPIELFEEGGKCSASFNKQVLVTLPKVPDYPPGKVVFGFRKVAFTIQDLKISGKLDRAWCEAQIAALEKSGKLLLKPPVEKKEGEEPPPPPSEEEKKKAESQKKKSDEEKDL
jgi:hypothetical protein